jgi:hypothetical protein
MWKAIFGDEPTADSTPMSREDWASVRASYPSHEEIDAIMHDLFPPPRDAEILEFKRPACPREKDE